jgi:hypothetical protein
MSEFKVGDIVKCIEPEGFESRFGVTIKENGIYKVSKVVKHVDCKYKDQLYIEKNELGNEDWWYTSCFELVKSDSV